jgi:hypothetical protein
MMGASALSLVRLRSAAWAAAAELTVFCLGKGKTNLTDTVSRARDWTDILTIKVHLPEVLAEWPPPLLSQTSPVRADVQARLVAMVERCSPDSFTAT